VPVLHEVQIGLDHILWSTKAAGQTLGPEQLPRLFRQRPEKLGGDGSRGDEVHAGRGEVADEAADEALGSGGRGVRDGPARHGTVGAGAVGEGQGGIRGAQHKCFRRSQDAGEGDRGVGAEGEGAVYVGRRCLRKRGRVD
ncbi:hypothetical protein CCHL11_06750, partial [Colletotrichum chlorophyti]